ncbi:hypothetical protein SERLADRAFT_455583 [Serpula lacrymans var. lacrymans S7.9]|uniref:Uncharacterized protein n=1 Tax=Serpula lacrymans var. lacrymans (strain S7.9) TaxID=578457 RepID=F8NG65_SERL9|nr:uncharacterized protein SERLADRAFT_455583 [Serpula lacrymans var. lacrymans S7.9]EGO31035.1 hypothetical protein SERLADRAFT_455583 [Serpula lacrymans var. lacrymans S7.9]
MMGLHKNILTSSRGSLWKVDKELAAMKQFMDENGMSYRDPDDEDSSAESSPGAEIAAFDDDDDGDGSSDTVPSDEYDSEYEVLGDKQGDKLELEDGRCEVPNSDSVIMD